ncbi:hypothetical protein FH608_006570 [Nonomuraea phyllanthi]|uniref:Uncharacterized protein n=1 Tax=Nonomuraea phyllanthi TaxID=2219224 RepID=A0A5C4WS16_9ACTN|nr:hypothetical protein FH608_006570 [Nonomuraea phyllanthi]
MRRARPASGAVPPLVGRRASGVGRRASGVGRRASGVGRRASGVGRRASGVGRSVRRIRRPPSAVPPCARHMARAVWAATACGGTACNVRRLRCAPGAARAGAVPHARRMAAAVWAATACKRHGVRRVRCAPGTACAERRYATRTAYNTGRIGANACGWHGACGGCAVCLARDYTGAAGGHPAHGRDGHAAGSARAGRARCRGGGRCRSGRPCTRAKGRRIRPPERGWGVSRVRACGSPTPGSWGQDTVARWAISRAASMYAIAPLDPGSYVITDCP